MIINITSSSVLRTKGAWSVNFLVPQKKVKAKEGYKLVNLRDLVDERREMIIPTPNMGKLSYIGLENIESKTGRLIDFAPKNASEIKSNCKTFLKGDILYGRLRPNLNKVYYNSIIQSGECSTEIIVLSPKLDIINPVYLSELLRSEAVNKRIVNIIKGASLPRVSMADLQDIELPIPPLNVQNKIAETIISKRNELEEHIKMAKLIPIELSDMFSDSFD